MTTVAIAPQPKLQFSQGGQPLSGGLLFTYQAGTSTKLNTYTDSTGNTPNANPIVLNANGEADVYLIAGDLYKFTLSPATDTDPPTNPFWSVDNLYCNAASAIPYADAGGTADAITATYVVPSPVLADGYFLILDIGTTNATTTPTFAPTLNGVLQTARTIRKVVGNANVALAAGDLQGMVMLVYDLGNLVWILQNPAGVANLQNTAPIKLPTITATVSANALTIGASAQYMDFRSATLTSGEISTINAAPANIVIPTTATLGTSNGAPSRLVVLELINAGVAELAVVNAAGGVNLDEVGVISTTAISAAATANNVIYSTTSRANVPFRVLGYIEITEATAGTWASAPTAIEPIIHATKSIAADSAGIPQNSQSAAYTTVLADANKHILHPTADNNPRTFTIDSNANVPYKIGTTLTFVNQINTLTIAITTDTLTWASAGTTGSRTLAANGIATALKISATEWLISGSGIT